MKAQERPRFRRYSCELLVHLQMGQYLHLNPRTDQEVVTCEFPDENGVIESRYPFDYAVKAGQAMVNLDNYTENAVITVIDGDQ